MKLHRNVGWLRDLPLFQYFSEEQLQLMAFNCHHRTYEDGQFLFHKDEQGLSAFVVTSGTVELIDYDGSQLYGEDDMLGTGTMIGEVAMIVRSQRPASVRAAGQVEAIEIPRAAFHRVLEEYPEIAEKIRQMMAARVAALVTDLKPMTERFTDEDA